jgi:hypothetical protein
MSWMNLAAMRKKTFSGFSYSTVSVFLRTEGIIGTA